WSATRGACTAPFPPARTLSSRSFNRFRCRRPTRRRSGSRCRCRACGRCGRRARIRRAAHRSSRKRRPG
ncbi:MAG: hypothetical protein AVDCRST_MAG88-1664, partial [uncultured Thermomicrobiales bacterium]